ncbi:TPA: TonB-dependent receptor, partial [Haemophilus influenzae]
VYKIKDKYGGELKYEEEKGGYYRKFKNSRNEDADNDISEGGSLDSVLINCEKLNCENKKFGVFVEKDEKWDNKYKYEERDIIVETLPNGKKYGVIKLKSTKGSHGLTQDEIARFLFPKSFGYSTDFVNDRDLNTHTQQIKLDLDKEFHLWHTQHQ